MPYTDSATGQTVLEMFLDSVEEMAAANIVEVEEPLVCEHTGEVIEGEPFTIGEHVYANEETAICAGWEHCEYCGEWIHCEFTSDYECVNSHPYCDSECAHSDGWFICERCGDWVHEEDAIYVDYMYYCSDWCAERDGWCRCDHCDEWVRSLDTFVVYTSHGDEAWCESCYDDDARTCYECGDACDEDDMHWDEDSEEWYCDHCYHEHGAGVLHSYGYCPGIEFFGGNAWAPKAPLFMGTELETDSGNNRTAYVKALSAIEGFDRHFWMTEDGSLSNGVEITSQPMTLAYHVGLRNMYSEIGEIANRYDFVSHNSGNCGLHIHVNRSFFGKSELCQDAGGYKLMRLLQRFERAFTIFSRRRNAQWCSYKTSRDYKPKEKVSIIKETPGEYNDSVKDYDALQLAHLMKLDERGHSQALNFQHRSTFEFRIFRGTLKWTTYFACLGLVDGMCRTVKIHGSTWVENVTWYDLMDEVIARCIADYPRECLVAYLEEKGLR